MPNSRFHLLPIGFQAIFWTFLSLVMSPTGPRVASLFLNTSKSMVNFFFFLNNHFTNFIFPDDNLDWRAKAEWNRPKLLSSSLVSNDKVKVNAVKWSPDGKHLVGCSEDGIAKLFSFDGKLKSKQFHSTHKEFSREKCKINAVEWVNEETVVTGDDQGNLVVWNVSAHQTRLLTLNRNSIFAMKVHPEDEEILAFACKLGLVYVVHIGGKGKIMEKIRVFDEDVQGLDWLTYPNLSSNPLLAVSGRNKCASIWDSKTGKKLLHTKLKSFGAWITLKWIKSSIFLSGGQGELFKWDLSTNELSEVHRDHFRHLFCLSHYQDLIFSCGYDRSLVCYNLSKQALEFNLPTFANKITCMAVNPIEPSIIAFGSGDGLIKVWKSKATKNMFDYTTIWQKGHCEITALVWHPEKENILAFATNEGRLGTVDALSHRPYPQLMDFKHRSSVYNLIYGPECILFTLGDGAIFQHGGGSGAKNLEDLIVEANPDFEARKPPSRSEMAFLDTDYIALGCDDGTIEILTWPDLIHVSTLKSFQKLVQSLAWQKSTQTLAVASNEFEIHLWKLENVEKGVFTRPDFVLEGHKARVIQLAWNPLDSRQLLSVSYDGTAQIWDVTTQQGLANFRGHSGRVFTGLWDPNGEADLVYTGGEDCLVCVWRPSCQTEKIPAKNNNKLRNLDKKATFVAAEDEPEPPVVEQELKKPTFKKLNKKAYFSQSLAKENASQTHADLSTLMTLDKLNIEENPHLAFFTQDEQDVQNLVNFEMGRDAELTDFFMDQWCGSSKIKEMLEKSAENLTDFHVSLASSIDHGLWKWACATFAKQLEEKGNPVKASSYYLMIKEVDKAISALVNANFFQSAMVIAKTRLAPGHPMIKDLYTKWAIQCAQDGNYETAAKCWFAIKDYSKAGQSLAKKSDGHTLRVAAQLLFKVDGEGEKAKILAQQALDIFEKEQDQKGLDLVQELICSNQK